MSTGILLLALAGMTLQGIFIAVEHKEKYIPAVVLKGTAALLFCIIGTVALATTSVDQSFARLVVIGLFCGMAGDILLNLRFVFPKIGQKIFLLGVAAFLTGHILYLCAIIPLSQQRISITSSSRSIRSAGRKSTSSPTTSTSTTATVSSSSRARTAAARPSSLRRSDSRY